MSNFIQIILGSLALLVVYYALGPAVLIAFIFGVMVGQLGEKFGFWEMK